MTDSKTITYHVALALMAGIDNRRKNEIFVRCFSHTPKFSIVELFDNPKVWDSVGLSDAEKVIFAASKTALAPLSFKVEDILSQGYAIIPIDSDLYPQKVKNSMGFDAPHVLFAKGNPALLGSDSAGIYRGGSRADAAILEKALQEGASGIIVLAQGITTFNTGYRNYYRPIIEGRIVVISPFAPTLPPSATLSPWRDALADALKQ